MALLLALFVGLSIIMVFVGLSIPSGPDAVQTRLQQYGSRPRTLAEMELSLPFSDRVVAPAIRGMALLVSHFAPQRNIDEIKHKLDLAGNPNHWTPSDLLGIRALSGMLVGGILFVFMFLLNLSLFQILLFAGVGAVLGFYGPLFWLNQKIKTRAHDILKALPDALDLLTICVEAGLGFDGAMVKVAEKADNELSRAFGRVNSEIRVGKLRREALRDMANRSGVPDVTNFIAAVIQADQLGVSMAKVLRIQSEQMRIKRRQRAEEQAAQAPVKMMFPLVFLVFPSIMIVLLGPAILIFMKSGFGS